MTPFLADNCPLDDPRYVYLLVDLGLVVYPGVLPAPDPERTHA
jgi:hypothetical protein